MLAQLSPFILVKSLEWVLKVFRALLSFEGRRGIRAWSTNRRYLEIHVVTDNEVNFLVLILAVLKQLIQLELVKPTKELLHALAMRILVEFLQRNDIFRAVHQVHDRERFAIFYFDLGEVRRGHLSLATIIHVALFYFGE